jgi:acetyltransferase-like isoleucine patch superfamily enzyme
MTARSHGSGRFAIDDLGSLGPGSVIEDDVLVFSPQQVSIGADVYVGHRTILHGDTRGVLRIEDGAWIGPECYMHSAGGIQIGARAGIGPRVMILTSAHRETPPPAPIMDGPLDFAPVTVGAGGDVGIGSILLPGATVGLGAQVGAGSVVTGEIPPGMIAAGAPARVLRRRGERPQPGPRD